MIQLVWVTVLDDLSLTLTQGHGCATDHPIITKLICSYIPPVIFIIWLHFEGIFFKISDTYFRGQTSCWANLRNGWFHWCETKSVFIDWMLGQLRDLAYWPDLKLRFSRSNFEKAVSQKRMGKGSYSIWCLAVFVASTLDLWCWLWFWRVRSWSRFDWGSIKMKWKRVNRSFMTMIMTMGGWSLHNIKLNMRYIFVHITVIQRKYVKWKLQRCFRMKFYQILKDLLVGCKFGNG